MVVRRDGLFLHSLGSRRVPWRHPDTVRRHRLRPGRRDRPPRQQHFPFLREGRRRVRPLDDVPQETVFKFLPEHPVCLRPSVFGLYPLQPDQHDRRPDHRQYGQYCAWRRTDPVRSVLYGL